MSRYNCYDTPKNTVNKVRENSWDTTLKHRFYDAGDCVKSIMGGSSNFITYSLFFALLLAFFF